MNQIANWIVPSHYRELKLSSRQRAAAKIIFEARDETAPPPRRRRVERDLRRSRPARSKATIRIGDR